MTVEEHYERLLFRTRAEKARLEARLAACEDLVRALADGSLAFIHADHAAKALLDTLEDEEELPPRREPWPLSEALAYRLAKESRRDLLGEDNPESCTNSNTDWECGGCGLFLGSLPSPDFGDYPCVCGKKNRPRLVHPNSHNHVSRRKPR